MNLDRYQRQELRWQSITAKNGIVVSVTPRRKEEVRLYPGHVVPRDVVTRNGLPRTKVVSYAM